MLVSHFCRFHGDSTKETAEIVKKAIPGIGRIILAASCKGGVGKSTVAINTAFAMQNAGAKIGLFDADIYGPSVPTMAQTSNKPLAADQDSNFLPITSNGIETVSIGNAIDPNAALMWKGPLVAKVIEDFVRKALWSNLDYLVVDTPPGTGDVHMNLASLLPIDGAVIVTTPQQIAVDDVIRSINAFKQLKIPILGIVQNFDSFVCDGCKTVTRIFPGKGAENIAKEFNLEILGTIPMDPQISCQADKGYPAVLQYPNSPFSIEFNNIAKKILNKLPKVPAESPARPRPNE